MTISKKQLCQELFVGIRLIPEGKLFFQEEFPDVIAEEALRLWRAD
jgi:hypothetical protein